MSNKVGRTVAAVAAAATVLWCADTATALPSAAFAPSSVSDTLGTAAPHDGTGLILVQNR